MRIFLAIQLDQTNMPILKYFNLDQSLFAIYTTKKSLNNI